MRVMREEVTVGHVIELPRLFFEKERVQRHGTLDGGLLVKSVIPTRGRVHAFYRPCMDEDVFLVCATLEDGLHCCKARGEAEFRIDELLLDDDYIGHLKEGLMAVTPRRDRGERVACAHIAPPENVGPVELGHMPVLHDAPC